MYSEKNVSCILRQGVRVSSASGIASALRRYPFVNDTRVGYQGK